MSHVDRLGAPSSEQTGPALEVSRAQSYRLHQLGAMIAVAKYASNPTSSEKFQLSAPLICSKLSAPIQCSAGQQVHIKLCNTFYCAGGTSKNSFQLMKNSPSSSLTIP